jgi:hypothetical protein
MIKYDYAHEKFSQAIIALVVNDLPLRERLSKAWLYIRLLNEENMPDEIRDDFRELRESKVVDMSDHELFQTANKIVDIAARIDYLYYQTVWEKPH